MTRHREDIGVYYGSRSFAKAGGSGRAFIAHELSETTLDYEKGAFYRAALRFADARGLHLVNVARTLVRDRRDWTVRQKQKLFDLTARLATIGAQLGLKGPITQVTPNPVMEAKPMVSGITTFPKSIDQAIEDRLVADPGLKKQWQEVTTRFTQVFVEPETAFKAVNVDAMLKDPEKSAEHACEDRKSRKGLERSKARPASPERTSGPRARHGACQRACPGAKTSSGAGDGAGRGRAQA